MSSPSAPAPPSGFSRVQLARKAKVSDATIKFIETACHPPSRATLLRLVAVAELGLRWAQTPGYSVGVISEVAAETSPALSDAEFSRFDSRLTLRGACLRLPAGLLNSPVTML